MGGDVTLTEWVVGEGGQVAQGDVVLRVETQKIKFDVEADVAGLLHIVVGEGSVCPMGTVVGVIAGSREELEKVQREMPRATSGTPATETPSSRPGPGGHTGEGTSGPRERGSIRVSPVARKIAEEHMIDVTTIVGTGPDGRIVREDVEKALATRAFLTEKAAAPGTTAPVQMQTQAGEAVEQAAFDGKAVKYTIPLRGMRRAIAEHLHRSLADSAQLTAMGEIDMSKAIGLRKEFLARESATGTKVTYNDIFVFALAKVLREKPIVNSSILGDEIKVWDDINIGVAVAVDDGLIVPVVRNADRKSISEISRITKDLARAAREGTLVPDQVTGGTFTITNLGAAGAGWRFETSIINPPESAIFGAGGITDRAVVRDGEIVIRPIMTYGFTYDHRVIDGALAVQFMARVVDLIENPALFAL
jgi:pyruvate dehydrogenase E2 component (dihydrolipoamide acetyltransferase)/2-oxoglutarate dehydrogenase E2 component (dihydrolipoamide succinyltransferase)